jgi:hypothetical protein
MMTRICIHRLQSSIARVSIFDEDVTSKQVYPPRARDVNISGFRRRAEATGKE